MAYRHSLNQAKDKRKFRNTAKKTKRINIAPKISRGGFQL